MDNGSTVYKDKLLRSIYIFTCFAHGRIYQEFSIFNGGYTAFYTT